ncbi:MAG: hypothetical protein ACOC93_06665, partial [Planctomycetota bacterium]
SLIAARWLWRLSWAGLALAALAGLAAADLIAPLPELALAGSEPFNHLRGQIGARLCRLWGPDVYFVPPNAYAVDTEDVLGPFPVPQWLPAAPLLVLALMAAGAAGAATTWPIRRRSGRISLAVTVVLAPAAYAVLAGVLDAAMNLYGLATDVWAGWLLPWTAQRAAMLTILLGALSWRYLARRNRAASGRLTGDASVQPRCIAPTSLVVAAIVTPAVAVCVSVAAVVQVESWEQRLLTAGPHGAVAAAMIAAAAGLLLAGLLARWRTARWGWLPLVGLMALRWPVWGSLAPSALLLLAILPAGDGGTARWLGSRAPASERGDSAPRQTKFLRYMPALPLVPATWGVAAMSIVWLGGVSQVSLFGTASVIVGLAVASAALAWLRRRAACGMPEDYPTAWPVGLASVLGLTGIALSLLLRAQMPPAYNSPAPRWPDTVKVDSSLALTRLPARIGPFRSTTSSWEDIFGTSEKEQVTFGGPADRKLYPERRSSWYARETYHDPNADLPDLSVLVVYRAQPAPSAADDQPEHPEPLFLPAAKEQLPVTLDPADRPARWSEQIPVTRWAFHMPHVPFWRPMINVHTVYRVRIINGLPLAQSHVALAYRWLRPAPYYAGIAVSTEYRKGGPVSQAEIDRYVRRFLRHALPVFAHLLPAPPNATAK